MNQWNGIPSHPDPKEELGTTASSNKDGDSPDRSKLDIHPSNPCLDNTPTGSDVYISLGTPPTYSTLSRSNIRLEPASSYINF